MIRKISVFAADIDGTLAEKGGDLMPKTRAAIQRLHNEAKSRSEISRIEEAVQALVHGTKNAAKEI